MDNEETKSKPEPLRARALANDMVRRMIGTRKHDDGFKDMIEVSGAQFTVADLLIQLANHTWLSDEGRATEQEQEELDRLLAIFDKAPQKIKNIVVDTMAHAGQLHQMAGLLARESLIANAPKEKTDAFNPVRQMLFKNGRRVFQTIEEALENIAVPRFEITATGHPTNTNSVESMRKQRMLAQAIVRMAENESYANTKQMLEALHDFACTPLLPMKDGQPTPLTVAKETQTMLYFLGNLYEDLPQTYGAFDNELAAAYKEYNPCELNLGIKFHSWGSSGDKDGNDNVNANTTLIALASHKDEIFKRYVMDLRALKLPGFEEDIKYLTEASTAAKSTWHLANSLRKTHNGIPPALFDELVERLRGTSQKVDLNGIMRKLEEQYETHKNAPKEVKQPILDLLRRMRTFGTSFGHIEYRETADEYTRVVERIIPGYAAMNEEKRCHALTELMQHPEALRPFVKTLQEMAAASYDKPYVKKSNPGAVTPLEEDLPIAYHTLKRMELARDFPDAIQNNVLAECKKTSNMLEALLLQHAVAKDGKRAEMGIVPLFEEHETLEAAPKIVRGALDNPAYQQHLTVIAKNNNGKEAQQIQLAHSDNFKRAGVAASRALLSRTHERLRQMIRDFVTENNHPLEIQFYEGGSQSDPLRGGARATSAMINAYSIHDFAKMTFQGGDLLNFFNLPAGTTRLLTNNLSNNITRAASKERPRLSAQEERVINVFDKAKSTYIDQLFRNPEFINFLYRIDYMATGEAGNFSSRMGNRTSKKLEQINDTRAIGYSEAMQHADFCATWAGVQQIEEMLGEGLGGEVKKLGPAQRKQLYREMAFYRDIVDKMLYGLMRSDLKFLNDTTRYHDGSEHPLMKEFREQYAEAFRLAIESYTGKPYTDSLKEEGALAPENLQATIESGKIRNAIRREVFPHVRDYLYDQDRFVKLAHHFEGWSKKPYTKDGVQEEITPQDRINNSLIHNMKDTVHHGIIPLITDTKFIGLYCDHYNIHRPHIQNGNGQGRGT